MTTQQQENQDELIAAKSREPVPPVEQSLEPAKIVKMVPRVSAVQKTAEERALAGEYRVIHGQIGIPLPPERWRKKNPDGSLSDEEIPGALKSMTAEMGDIVWLNNEDAMRCIDADLVEPVDAKPSRLGKVWQPPKPIANRPS